MAYLPLSQDVQEQVQATAPFDVEAALRRQGEALAALKKTTEQQLVWRKVAAGAAVAGALFAMIRLTDIWLAVRRRRGEL